MHTGHLSHSVTGHTKQSLAGLEHEKKKMSIGPGKAAPS
jgi:hypothetical protein